MWRLHTEWCGFTQWSHCWLWTDVLQSSTAVQSKPLQLFQLFQFTHTHTHTGMRANSSADLRATPRLHLTEWKSIYDQSGLMISVENIRRWFMDLLLRSFVKICFRVKVKVSDVVTLSGYGRTDGSTCSVKRSLSLVSSSAKMKSARDSWNWHPDAFQRDVTECPSICSNLEGSLSVLLNSSVVAWVHTMESGHTHTHFCLGVNVG